jgi:hypothetical protein
MHSSQPLAVGLAKGPRACCSCQRGRRDETSSGADCRTSAKDMHAFPKQLPSTHLAPCMLCKVSILAME